MSSQFQPGANLYTQGFGSRPENVEVPHIDVRDPSSSDVNGYPVGKRWINTVAKDEWVLTSFSSSQGITTANWVALGGSSVAVETLSGNTGGALAPTGGNINVVGSGALAFAGAGSTLTGSITPGTALVSTITGTSGGALSPTAGNINILGTANQISSTGLGSSLTLALPSALTAPGSITATTTLTATSGNITATNGNLVLNSAGNKVFITPGINASVGTSSAMTAGVVTVTTSAVSANSLIFAIPHALGTVTTPKAVYVSSKSAGVSFTLTSADATDTSTWDWWIIN